jgi:hypothetical protein
LKNVNQKLQIFSNFFEEEYQNSRGPFEAQKGGFIMLVRMANMTDKQLKDINCKCTDKQRYRFDDFMSHLSARLRIKRKQHVLSYGNTINCFLEEANISYLEAHKLGGWELKKIYRKFCKQKPMENEHTIYWVDPEGHRIIIGKSKADESGIKSFYKIVN